MRHVVKLSGYRADQGKTRFVLQHRAGEEALRAYRNVRAGDVTEVTDDIRRVTGRAPLDFPSWARRALAE